MAKNHVVANLYRIERLDNSYYGNPRADFHTDKGTFRSVTDAGFMYGAWNGRPEGKTVELTVTDAGRVYDMRILTGKLIQDV